MHTHRTRSRSANSPSRQQFTESKVTTLSHLSPIPSSPIPPQSTVTDEQSNTKPLQPSNLSMKMEETIIRESSPSIENKSSSSVEHSPLSTSFSFSQLIGPDTQRRIQISNTLNALQQQITDLNIKNDANLKVFNDKNDRNLEFFEYLSLQMTNNSKLIGQLILQSQQFEINNSHAKSTDTITSINTNTSPDLPLNTTYSNLSTPQIGNYSIFNSTPSISSSLTSKPFHLNIKDMNSFLENSVHTITSTQSLRNYTTSKSDTPALLLNTHEATCDVYNISQEFTTQLFLAHIRKYNPDIYQTFLLDTKLPRSSGKSRFDNPTAAEFASWSWSLFRISFTSIFEDQNLHLKIKNTLDSWCSNTFKSFDDACKAHLLIMKDIQYSKDNLLSITPQTLQQLCQLHVQPLRATINQTFASELTLYMTTSNLYATTNQKPANFLLLTYENLILVSSEYAIHKSKEDAYFSIFKPKSNSNNINNTKHDSNLKVQRVNLIRKDITCKFCSKIGHQETECLKKNPELIKNFTCRTCSQQGHMTFFCPNKTQ